MDIVTGLPERMAVNFGYCQERGVEIVQLSQVDGCEH